MGFPSPHTYPTLEGWNILASTPLQSSLWRVNLLFLSCPWLLAPPDIEYKFYQFSMPLPQCAFCSVLWRKLFLLWLLFGSVLIQIVVSNFSCLSCSFFLHSECDNLWHLKTPLRFLPCSYLHSHWCSFFQPCFSIIEQLIQLLVQQSRFVFCIKI